MRIYIIEDDLSVINILEDIIEDEELGEICGDCGGEPAVLSEVLACQPDVVLVDFFMPKKDGVEFVRELREVNEQVKCIMISQVSAKDLIAKAYSAGIDFFISKPINIIEISSVLRQVEKQIQQEKTLDHIRRVFLQEAPSEKRNEGSGRSAQESPERKREGYEKSLRYILNRIGISSEKGSPDILKICNYLHENGKSVSELSVQQMCSAVDENPKSTEQRVRRAIAAGMTNVAHMGIEDFMNETYSRYSGSLFSFEDVKMEMDHLRGKRVSGGKVNIKKFIDGLMLEAER